MALFLDFTNVYLSNFQPHHYVGHTSEPYGRQQNHVFASILSKMYSLALHK